MSEFIFRLNKRMSALKFNIFKKDIVFTISFVLALISSFIYMPRIDYINFKVVFSLFNLMLVVKAFEELKLLDIFAISIVNKCNNSRRVALVLISLCFFSSMFMTNDVALITFVPLSLIIGKKTGTSMIDTIIFQTLAANIGSSLTPMGNPQNLFVFSYYGLSTKEFFVTIGAFVILGGLWLLILNNRIKRKRLNITLDGMKIEDKKETLVWFACFAIITMSIIGLLSYKIAFIITLIAVLMLKKNLLLKIDYLLLATFVCFFIFIGNIANIEVIHNYMRDHLSSITSVYLGSILSSQFISNVPSAILLSKFTDHWRPLLLGVNVGGMGTIISSLASVISYKLFIRDNQESGKLYMIKFTVYNLISLILLACAGYIALTL